MPLSLVPALTIALEHALSFGVDCILSQALSPDSSPLVTSPISRDEEHVDNAMAISSLLLSAQRWEQISFSQRRSQRSFLEKLIMESTTVLRGGIQSSFYEN